jgi:hypothetical protein
MHWLNLQANDQTLIFISFSSVFDQKKVQSLKHLQANFD